MIKDGSSYTPIEGESIRFAMKSKYLDPDDKVVLVKEIPIDTHSEGFKLITRIQDEAHRFAIEYHRSIRSKEQVRSVLDEIPGVGPARRKALMKCFDSIEEIKQAEAQELHEKAGIPLSTAEEIYSFFHGSVVE